MGQEEWGHKQLFTDPLPPSSNRDKIHFSRGELINTLWPLLILSGRDLGWIQFSFNIIFCKLPKVKDNDAKNATNATNCVETETQKWTWDMGQKKFDPSPHKNMSPFWWAKKRGFFLPPSLPYGPMSPSQQFFFFECFPNTFQYQKNMSNWKDKVLN